MNVPDPRLGEVGRDLGRLDRAEIWRTDGTAAGTWLLASTFLHGNPPADFVAAGGTAYFVANHPDFGREVWGCAGRRGAAGYFSSAMDHEHPG